MLECWFAMIFCCDNEHTPFFFEKKHKLSIFFKNTIQQNPNWMTTGNEFGVGKGNRRYRGFRPLTGAEWRDRSVATRLVREHGQRGGLVVLENPLMCTGGLHVADGCVEIDGCFVTVVGKVSRVDLRIEGVYSVMNWSTEVPWSVTPPPIDESWSVVAHEIKDYPCVFIRQV